MLAFLRVAWLRNSGPVFNAKLWSFTPLVSEIKTPRIVVDLRVRKCTKLFALAQRVGFLQRQPVVLSRFSGTAIRGAQIRALSDCLDNSSFRPSAPLKCEGTFVILSELLLVGKGALFLFKLCFVLCSFWSRRHSYSHVI